MKWPQKVQIVSIARKGKTGIAVSACGPGAVGSVRMVCLIVIFAMRVSWFLYLRARMKFSIGWISSQCVHRPRVAGTPPLRECGRGAWPTGRLGGDGA